MVCSLWFVVPCRLNYSFLVRLILLCQIFLLTAGNLFAQSDSIFLWNSKLIRSCDSYRMTGEHKIIPKASYDDILKRDKKVVAFLNLFHSNILDPSTLKKGLNKVRVYSTEKKLFKDTLFQQAIISER